MDKQYEKLYHTEELTNWWHVSRRDMILKLIHQFKVKKESQLLDIGCSGGVLLDLLSKKGFDRLYGIDISKDAIKLCKNRKLKNTYVINGTKTEFKDNTFDLIIASDVLEHIKDDNKALDEWYRILKPEGILIVFVPSFNFLWSHHDKVNQHFRRYTITDLSKKTSKAKFKIIKTSYWNILLFFPVAIIRLLQKNTSPKKSGQLYTLNAVINRCLTYLLHIENWLLKFLPAPIGISTFQVLKKETSPLSSKNKENPL